LLSSSRPAPFGPDVGPLGRALNSGIMPRRAILAVDTGSCRSRYTLRGGRSSIFTNRRTNIPAINKPIAQTKSMPNDVLLREAADSVSPFSPARKSFSASFLSAFATDACKSSVCLPPSSGAISPTGPRAAPTTDDEETGCATLPVWSDVEGLGHTALLAGTGDGGTGQTNHRLGYQGPGFV